MTISAFQVIDELTSRHPALLSLAEEHKQYFDEMLPHHFFGDVVRWCESRALDDPELKAVFCEMDDYFERGDDSAQNLICVSFIENFGSDSPYLSRLGPILLETEMAKYMMGKVKWWRL